MNMWWGIINPNARVNNPYKGRGDSSPLDIERGSAEQQQHHHRHRPAVVYRFWRIVIIVVAIMTLLVSQMAIGLFLMRHHVTVTIQTSGEQDLPRREEQKVVITRDFDEPGRERDFITVITEQEIVSPRPTHQKQKYPSQPPTTFGTKHYDSETESSKANEIINQTINTRPSSLPTNSAIITSSYDSVAKTHLETNDDGNGIAPATEHNITTKIIPHQTQKEKYTMIIVKNETGTDSINSQHSQETHDNINNGMSQTGTATSPPNTQHEQKLNLEKETSTPSRTNETQQTQKITLPAPPPKQKSRARYPPPLSTVADPASSIAVIALQNNKKIRMHHHSLQKKQLLLQKIKEDAMERERQNQLLKHRTAPPRPSLSKLLTCDKRDDAWINLPIDGTINTGTTPLAMKQLPLSKEKQWNEAYNASMRRIRSSRLGGKYLRDFASEEVEQLRILRYQIVCG